MDLTNVKSGVMSRTGGSGTGGSARPEEVQEQRECTSGGSVQVEEGQSSWRKVQSWTWKCPKTLVDLTEEAELRAGAELSQSWMYQLELGYIADKAKGVARLKPE